LHQDAEGFAHAEEQRFQLHSQALGVRIVPGGQCFLEFVGLAGLEQKLRLCLQTQRRQTQLLAPLLEGAEIHVGGDVAVSRIGKHIFESLMPRVAHQRPARKTPARGDFGSRVAVVNRKYITALQRAADALQLIQRSGLKSIWPPSII
jgi:hypothetical protein